MSTMQPIDAKEAARRIGCSQSLILKLARAGELKGWKVAPNSHSHWRFDPAEVSKYLDSRMNEPTRTES